MAEKRGRAVKFAAGGLKIFKSHLKVAKNVN